jgi:nitrite reductase (NO-forming)
MIKRSTWHLRVGAVVLAWLTAALVAGILALTHDVSTWLLVHLLLLGAVSNAILVWSSHFSAAMLRLPESGRARDESARLVLFNVGAVAVVVGMTLIDRPELAWAIVIAGGAVVGEVVIWHAIDLIRRLRRALPSRFGATIRYYVVAALFLPFGILIGVLLAPADLSEERSAQLVLAHVSINVLGWMGLTVLGTLVTLWPTMLHTQVADGSERSARRALPVLGLGVAVLASGALLGSRALAVVGLACYLAGIVVVGVPRVRETRRRRPRTYATWSVMLALVWFVASVVTLGIILATASDWEAADELAEALAAPLLIGFAAQLLLGALSFLIPVVLGGGPTIARRTNATFDRLAVVRLVLVNGGLLLSLLPIDERLGQVPAMVVLAGLASFLPLAVTAVVQSRRPSGYTVASSPTT